MEKKKKRKEKRNIEVTKIFNFGNLKTNLSFNAARITIQWRIHYKTVRNFETAFSIKHVFTTKISHYVFL